MASISWFPCNFGVPSCCYLVCIRVSRAHLLIGEFAFGSARASEASCASLAWPG